MIVTRLTLECLVKQIRYAQDLEHEYVFVVKKILEYIEAEALNEDVAATYLVAAYQEYEIARKFREARTF